MAGDLSVTDLAGYFGVTRVSMCRALARERQVQTQAVDE